MIYWSLAVPVAIWWTIFIWHLIKTPHLIYKENFENKPANPIVQTPKYNWVLTLILMIIIPLLVVALIYKNHQIHQLTVQLKTASIKVAPPEEISKSAPEEIASRCFENGMQVFIPGEIADYASQCFDANNYTNTITLLERAIKYEDGDFSWRKDYPIYAGSLLITGNPNGRSEFEQMIAEIKSGNPHYKNVPTKALLVMMGQARKHLSKQGDKDFVDEITKYLDNKSVTKTVD